MHLNEELVSVIVLSYGPGKYYQRTLLSVLAQTYPAIDLIVSDDGSLTFQMEETESFIRQNMGSNVKRLLVRKNKHNLGISKHDNLAASLAKGKYIKFIADGDVFCTEHSLCELHEFACNHQEWIITSPCIICNEDMTVDYYQHPSAGRIKRLNHQPLASLHEALVINNFISAVGCIFRREFFEQGGFDERYRYLEDWPTWLKTIRNGERIPCSNIPSERYALSGISSAYATAFESPRLRKDLMLCYEKEIIPNAIQLPWLKQYFVQYRYLMLKNQLTTVQKIKFIPLILYYKGKALMKKLLFIYKQGGKR